MNSCVKLTLSQLAHRFAKGAYTWQDQCVR